MASTRARAAGRADAAFSEVAVTEVSLVVTAAEPGDERPAGFDALLAVLIEAGTRTVRVDLSRVDGGDTRRLLSILATARARLVDRGAELFITGVPSPVLLEALAQASLHEVFLIYAATRDTPPRDLPTTGTRSAPVPRPRRPVDRLATTSDAGV